MKKFPSKEYELIRRLQDILPPVNRSSSFPYEMTIGDDAAVRVNNAAGERLVITADVSVDGVHFSRDTMTFEEIGFRAMVSNLSDCAAMGAKPDSAVVQIVFPRRDDTVDTQRSIEQIYTGFARACERWDFHIVGGDLSGGNTFTIAITLIGSVPPNSRVVKRQGAVDGDMLWATGVPGQSAAGLACLQKWGRAGVPARYKRFVDAHITPEPRIDEGMAFAAESLVHAMMDLSDGLSKDVATLCYDNDLGFVFDSPPAIEAMIRLSDDIGHDRKDWYYHGGEEYELLIACAPSYAPPNCIRIGQFTSERQGMFIIGEDGLQKELPVRSWDHISI